MPSSKKRKKKKTKRPARPMRRVIKKSARAKSGKKRHRVRKKKSAKKTASKKTAPKKTPPRKKASAPQSITRIGESRPGQRSLTLDAVHGIDAFEACGRSGNGYDWGSVVDYLVLKRAPEIRSELHFDPEAD